MTRSPRELRVTSPEEAEAEPEPEPEPEPETPPPPFREPLPDPLPFFRFDMLSLSRLSLLMPPFLSLFLPPLPLSLLLLLLPPPPLMSHLRVCLSIKLISLPALAISMRPLSRVMRGVVASSVSSRSRVPGRASARATTCSRAVVISAGEMF